MTGHMAALRIGTRRSPMALAQAETVGRLITGTAGRAVELVPVTTFGDVSRSPLSELGGTGVFVSGLRERLLDGEVDIAVHSLKDLPTMPAAGIDLAAVPARDDPRDALITADGAKLADLRPGARIGTGSPRRAAQLRLLRPDAVPVAIRGNAGTRLAKVSSGELDGVVLGYAGLARIGRLAAVAEVFDPDEMLPAPGQGALAAECRAGDEPVAALLAAIDDPASSAAVTAERSLLAALGGGCSVPVAAYAARSGRAGALHLRAAVFGADGGFARAAASAAAADPARLGRRVARDLLRAGAGDYISVPTARASDGGDQR